MVGEVTNAGMKPGVVTLFYQLFMAYIGEPYCNELLSKHSDTLEQAYRNAINLDDRLQPSNAEKFAVISEVQEKEAPSPSPKQEAPQNVDLIIDAIKGTFRNSKP